MDKPMIEGESFTLSDRIADHETSETDRDMIDRSLKVALRKSLKVLSDKDRYVLEMYFGLSEAGTKSISEISKVLGVMDKTVYQIRDRALKRLRKSGAANHLRNYLMAS
jgi:RNA polymerase primary sigma factor